MWRKMWKDNSHCIQVFGFGPGKRNTCHTNAAYNTTFTEASENPENICDNICEQGLFAKCKYIK